MFEYQTEVTDNKSLLGHNLAPSLTTLIYRRFPQMAARTGGNDNIPTHIALASFVVLFSYRREEIFFRTCWRLLPSMWVYIVWVRLCVHGMRCKCLILVVNTQPNSSPITCTCISHFWLCEVFFFFIFIGWSIGCANVLCLVWCWLHLLCAFNVYECMQVYIREPMCRFVLARVNSDKIFWPGEPHPDRTDPQRSILQVRRIGFIISYRSLCAGGGEDTIVYASEYFQMCFLEWKIRINDGNIYAFFWTHTHTQWTERSVAHTLVSS